MDGGWLRTWEDFLRFFIHSVEIKIRFRYYPYLLHAYKIGTVSQRKLSVVSKYLTEVKFKFKLIFIRGVFNMRISKGERYFSSKPTNEMKWLILRVCHYCF